MVVLLELEWSIDHSGGLSKQAPRYDLGDVGAEGTRMVCQGCGADREGFACTHCQFAVCPSCVSSLIRVPPPARPWRWFTRRDRWGCPRCAAILTPGPAC